jgi:DNA-binding IclR family transcriptional regulator
MRLNNSLVKGLAILEYVATSSQGAKVSDIAKKFSLPTSNLTLFLKSLTETGYIIKNLIDGRYYISDKIDRIAKKIKTSRYIQLEGVAKKEMEKLHNKYDENILLAVLNNYRLQFIVTLQSSKNVQILNNDNRSFIPHVTAGGKAILAYLSDELLTKYFENVELVRFTPKTLTKKRDILQELKMVRKNGYAINLGEYEDVVMAVAAPVFQNETVIASVVVQFPTFRYKEKELSKHAGDIIETANRIGLQISQKTEASSRIFDILL